MPGVSPVARRVSQKRDDPEPLEKGTGPSVSQDQRDGCRSPTALMDEVNTRAIDGAAIVVEGGEFIQLSFPVEPIFPVVAELPHEVEIDAVIPTRAGYFIGPAGLSQAEAEIFNGGFGVGQRKWLDVHGVTYILQIEG